MTNKEAEEQEKKVEKKEKRAQSIGEQIANGTSHVVMALFGIVAMVLLIKHSVTISDAQIRVSAIVGSIIFGLSIFLLYTMSTLYHSLAFTKAAGVFKRFDHISIYLLIGGTFAPILLTLPGLRNQPFFGISWFPLDMGLTLFIIQWVLITIGIVLKSIWIKKFKYIHIAAFLLLGWTAISFINILYDFSIPAFWLILAGGVSYSLGVIFYVLSSKIKYSHFIWHLFVAMGTILQFLAIYLYILP